MCFYDAIEMACKCWKWGQFRKHCAKEYRIGETCGMKLVMSRHSLPIKCKICTKIDGKERAIRKEEERIRRWQAENNGVNSFVQDAWQEDISQYQLDISRLLAERDERRGTWA
ncbi:hypothetical protein N431DRAFT_343797 [Stipitochalara longipes BDJ]|nr:hypothetical protein N431DRAFT_343797 [Stipitochalara longipes BDJ]